MDLRLRSEILKPHKSKDFKKKEIKQFAEDMIDWMQSPLNYVFKDFLAQSGLSRSNLDYFKKHYDFFADAYKLCQNMQEFKIAQDALRNKIQTTFAIFMLKNAHGWQNVEETKNKHTITINDLLKDMKKTKEKIEKGK